MNFARASAPVIHDVTDFQSRFFQSHSSNDKAETTAELDALLPALLDRAFKGEL